MPVVLGIRGLRKSNALAAEAISRNHGRYGGLLLSGCLPKCLPSVLYSRYTKLLEQKFHRLVRRSCSRGSCEDSVKFQDKSTEYTYVAALCGTDDLKGSATWASISIDIFTLSDTSYAVLAGRSF